MVADPDPDGTPSAMRTYRECIRALSPDATHLLIVQDDAVPTPNFHARALQRVAERPTDLVTFFVPGTGLHGVFMRNASAEGASWCALPSSVRWAPTVALCWPRELVEPFALYADEYAAKRAKRGHRPFADDPVVGGFRKAEGLTVWATVPCLVEHPDHVPSLLKRKSYAGRYPSRRAVVLADD